MQLDTRRTVNLVIRVDHRGLFFPLLLPVFDQWNIMVVVKFEQLS